MTWPRSWHPLPETTRSDTPGWAEPADAAEEHATTIRKVLLKQDQLATAGIGSSQIGTDGRDADEADHVADGSA
jgi:hypothetical protein